MKIRFFVVWVLLFCLLACFFKKIFFSSFFFFFLLLSSSSFFFFFLLLLLSSSSFFLLLSSSFFSSFFFFYLFYSLEKVMRWWTVSARASRPIRPSGMPNWCARAGLTIRTSGLRCPALLPSWRSSLPRSAWVLFIDAFMIFSVYPVRCSSAPNPSIFGHVNKQLLASKPWQLLYYYNI